MAAKEKSASPSKVGAPEKADSIQQVDINQNLSRIQQIIWGLVFADAILVALILVQAVTILSNRGGL